MTDHTLEEIVAAEHEIQARLAEEQRQAAAWLAAEREVINRTTEAELAEARRQCQQQIAAAEGEAGDGVDEMVRRAEAYAARLQGLSEERLRLQLVENLPRLLPEPRP